MTSIIDPAIPVWPSNLAPRKIARRRRHPVNLGPEAVSGDAQSIVADAGRWAIDYSQVPTWGTFENAAASGNLFTFRALVDRICSPLRPVYVPMRDYLRTPRAIAGIAGSVAIPFSDGSTFSDGSSFGDQPVDFTVAVAAAMRANVVTIQPSGLAAVSIQAGQFIGLGERAYRINQVFANATIAGAFDCSIWPFLRVSASIGDPVWTEDPLVKCMIDPKLAELSEDLDMDRLGYADCGFIEWGPT